jgi:hypothetical protein
MMRRVFRRLVRPGLIVAASLFVLWRGTLSKAAEPSDTQPVKLEVIKYEELKDVVRSLHGKVVVVDIWGEF